MSTKSAGVWSLREVLAQVGLCEGTLGAAVRDLADWRIVEFIPSSTFYQHHQHLPHLLCTARPAKPEEVDSYLHRMQERGWDASNTVAKLLRNNARFSLEVRDVSRVEGLLSDAAMIGALMWTTDPQTHLWWPVEVLDPFNMPAGRVVEKEREGGDGDTGA